MKEISKEFSHIPPRLNFNYSASSGHGIDTPNDKKKLQLQPKSSFTSFIATQTNLELFVCVLLICFIFLSDLSVICDIYDYSVLNYKCLLL